MTPKKSCFKRRFVFLKKIHFIKINVKQSQNERAQKM